MTFNKDEIRQIIENHLHRNGWGNKEKLPDWIIDKIYSQQSIEAEVREDKADMMDFIIQEYEDICEFDCEHDEAYKDTDEYCDGPGPKGEGHFTESQIYVCPVCGKTAPYNTVRTEDGYDEEIGEWQ